MRHIVNVLVFICLFAFVMTVALLLVMLWGVYIMEPLMKLLGVLY